MATRVTNCLAFAPGVNIASQLQMSRIAMSSWLTAVQKKKKKSISNFYSIFKIKVESRKKSKSVTFITLRNAFIRQ